MKDAPYQLMDTAWIPGMFWVDNEFISIMDTPLGLTDTPIEIGFFWVSLGFGL